MLPYKGSDAMHIISSMQKQVNRALPDDVKMTVSYTGKKLITCFNVKDESVFNHEHDIVYRPIFCWRQFKLTLTKSRLAVDVTLFFTSLFLLWYWF